MRLSLRIVSPLPHGNEACRNGLKNRTPKNYASKNRVRSPRRRNALSVESASIVQSAIAAVYLLLSIQDGGFGRFFVSKGHFSTLRQRQLGKTGRTARKFTRLVCSVCGGMLTLISVPLPMRSGSVSAREAGTLFLDSRLDWAVVGLFPVENGLA